MFFGPLTTSKKLSWSFFTGGIDSVSMSAIVSSVSCRHIVTRFWSLSHCVPTQTSPVAPVMELAERETSYRNWKVSSFGAALAQMQCARFRNWRRSS
jgi:hypothetical protein